MPSSQKPLMGSVMMEICWKSINGLQLLKIMVICWLIIVLLIRKQGISNDARMCTDFNQVEVSLVNRLSYNIRGKNENAY